MPLMTQEEYSKVKHKTPYVYKIQKGKQILYYFGEKHSFNPIFIEYGSGHAVREEPLLREMLTKN